MYNKGYQYQQGRGERKPSTLLVIESKSDAEVYIHVDTYDGRNGRTSVLRVIRYKQDAHGGILYVETYRESNLSPSVALEKARKIASEGIMGNDDTL
jgi:hypothetical protein